MKRKLTFALMALSLGGFSQAEQEPAGKPRPGGFLQQMDKNGDGQITKDEAPAQAWENFLSKRDANSDGIVSKEELAAGGFPARPGGPEGTGGGGMFQFFDKDSDGKITQAEAGERWERLGKLDKNADGVVSKEEVPNFGGGPGGGRPNPGPMIAQLDTDKDGKVTQAEAGERWERLGKLDKNGDGAVSKDEIPAFGAGGPGAGHFNPGEMIGRMDTDKDGKVTQAEAGERWERLGKLDKNGDGAVSKDEIPAFGAGGPGAGHFNPAEMIGRMDTDKDGKVTQAEAGERWERLGKLDKNGDGAITKDEMPAPGAGGPRGKPGEGKTQRPPAET